MDTLTIFHYHLLTGGISQVISASLSALLSSETDPPISGIQLVCGSEKNAEAVSEEIRSAAASAGREDLNVDLHVLPEIRYFSEMEEIPEPEKIKEMLLGRFGGGIWWVHNYHIGKNPLFTEALLRIAEKNREQRMVFHIHDFPESGRFNNLELLYSHISTGLYPLGPHIRYAVINGRDYSILSEAGIPEDCLFLLDNPVAPSGKSGPREEEENTDTDKEAGSPAGLVRDYCSSESSWWEEAGKLALYPIRSIKRKNVLEAGFLVRLLPRPVNLLVTLPGVSAQQEEYSDFVGKCFSEGLIPGAWPVGTQLDEIGLTFSQLIGASDIIVSSSIQEGFGYLFLNSLAWRKPLLSRDLDILDGMRGIFEGYPAQFYSSLLVPLTASGREKLLQQYRERVLPVLTRVLSRRDVHKIEKELEDICSRELVDFSYLSPELQRESLERLFNPAYRKEVEDVNAALIESLTAAMEERTVDKSGELEERFGPEAHARELRRIIASVNTAYEGEYIGEHNGKCGKIHQKILHMCTRTEYMRLLYF
ncbi:MAG: hypothetical protein R6V67_05675 [Spirochaetia bacterium]